MNKNFRKELRLFNDNKRINEKLMILAIYNEFYSDVMEAVGDNAKEEYTFVIEKAFDLVVKKISNSKVRNVSAEKFMKMFFSAIKNHRLFNTPTISPVINNIESQLSNAKSVLSFAQTIDQFEEIPLDSKLDIMLEFREYVNGLSNTLNGLFGDSDATLAPNVVYVLIDHLGKYLNYCKKNKIAPSKIGRRIEPIMKKITKKYLMFRLDKDRFNAPYSPDSKEFEIFDSLSDLEQKIWLLELIYKIVDYHDNSDKIFDKKALEICKFLDISKFRYVLTTLSMGLRSLNILTQAKNDNNSYNRKRC